MEIKFHSRPTQINRKNPVVVTDEYLLKVYMYPLKGDFYVRFVVVGSTSFVGLVKTDDPMNVCAIAPEHTIHDVYNKMDLIHYIIGYLNIPLRDIESIYNG